MRDLRFVIRSLLKTPGFTVTAVVTLALCIGANSAIFSAVHAILLKPYPWRDSERLVYVFNKYPLIGLDSATVSIPDYLDRRVGIDAFADCAIYHNASFNLSELADPVRITGLVATPSLFSTIETAAELGRVFTEEEAKPGQGKVVVLSYAFWMGRFGGDLKVVGKTIRMNAEPYVVIGVMPKGFYFPSPHTEVWVPFVFTPQQRTDSERGTEYSLMIARLKPGAAPAAVQAQLDSIQRRNERDIPSMASSWRSVGFGGRIEGFLDHNVANLRGMLWLLQAGVGVALLIGCANVASLLLARAVGRERELAVRAALGAGRSRLVRLLLMESVVISLAGAAVGLLVAVSGIETLNAMGLSSLPRAFAVRLDLAVFDFTFLCSLGVGLVFGAIPAWSASRGDTAALKEAGIRTTSGRRTQRLRASLVIAEIALAVMLLSTAGLLVKSFSRLEEQNPGFDPRGVITARLDLPTAKYDRPEKIIAFHDAAVASLCNLPGATEVGVATLLPFTGDNMQSSYSSPEIRLPAGAPLPNAQVRNADTGFLRALGLRLARGRWFTEADALGATQVAVVDEVLADHNWRGQDPLGKHVSLDDNPTDPKHLWTIVGVVAPIKVRNLEENVTEETIYFPLAQQPGTGLFVIVKTGGEPGGLAAGVRAAVRSADPEQPVFDVKTMAQRMDDVAQPRRTTMVLLCLFSCAALLLAALGVYGLLAFSVAQRTAEIGIRVALGASSRDIAMLVVGKGAMLVTTGIFAGLVGYLALSRLLGRLVYGVTSTDPLVLVAAPALLAFVALAACLLPTRRATRIDPAIALRAE